MKANIVENGLFRVYKDGLIERWSERDGWIVAPQCKTSRDGRYLAVTGMVNGKQKHFYVHRLIGNAFIPNPESKPQINHIDGNGQNNHVSNLQWVTAKENIQHAYDNGLFQKIVCRICKKEVFMRKETYEKRGHMCGKCHANHKNDLKQLNNALSRLVRLRKELETARPRNNRDELILELRSSGKTLQEIGDQIGITRERTRQIINIMKDHKRQTNKKNIYAKEKAAV